MRELDREPEHAQHLAGSLATIVAEDREGQLEISAWLTVLPHCLIEHRVDRTDGKALLGRRQRLRPVDVETSAPQHQPAGIGKAVGETMKNLYVLARQPQIDRRQFTHDVMSSNPSARWRSQ